MSAINHPDECCSACASTAQQDKAALPTVCTLEASASAERLAEDVAGELFARFAPGHAKAAS